MRGSEMQERIWMNIPVPSVQRIIQHDWPIEFNYFLNGEQPHNEHFSMMIMIREKLHPSQCETEE